MEELAKLIMARYYLANVLEVTDLDLSVQEVELFEKALKEVGSVSKLKSELDDYIKNNDWTDCLGEAGSGNRERGFAIDGCIEYAEPSVRHEDNELGDEFFESIFLEAKPAGFAIVADGKIWDNALSEEKANRLVDYLNRKGLFEDVHVISPSEQDHIGIPNWTYDEKKELGIL